MPTADEVPEFLCPKCSRKLKIRPEIAGRRVKCPGCAQVVRVPGARMDAPQHSSTTAGASLDGLMPDNVQPAPPAVADDSDWISLDKPAIDDAGEREIAAAKIKAQKAAAKARQHRLNSKTSALDPAEVKPLVVPHSRRQAAEAVFGSSEAELETDGGIPPSTVRREPTILTMSTLPWHLSIPRRRRRIEHRHRRVARNRFLMTICPNCLHSHPSRPNLKSKSQMNLEDALGDLEGYLPDPAAVSSYSNAGEERPLPGLLDVPGTTDHEYRVLCKVCGTAQYVRLSSQGMKVKCPDCFSDFKVPPPPAGWTPKKKKRQAAGRRNAADGEFSCASGGGVGGP